MKKVMIVGYIICFILIMLDVVLTVYGISLGAVEGNPYVINSLSVGVWFLVFKKLVVFGLTILVMEKLFKYDDIKIATLYLINGILLWASIENILIIKHLI